MRIAFVAPFQGDELLNRRPIEANLSLGGRAKIALLVSLLRKACHDVEILSQGEVVLNSARFFPAFEEPDSGRPGATVRYASALPFRFINGPWSSLSTLNLLKRRHRSRAFDLVIIYNLKLPQVMCARYALNRLGLPVLLEYEDDHFLDTTPASGLMLTSDIGLKAARRLLGHLSGCVAGSADLLSQVPEPIPRLLLPGVVGDAIVSVTGGLPRRNRVVFSGTHSPAQGLTQLVRAWRTLALPGWELHIAGHGAVTSTLHELAQGDPTVVFHGVLNARANADLLASGRICVVPYEVSTTRGFSFKTVEALAAGLHVVTTRLTALEALPGELGEGLTYLDGNSPDVIASTLRHVIAERRFERTVRDAALRWYGPEPASLALGGFLGEALAYHGAHHPAGARTAGR